MKDQVFKVLKIIIPVSIGVYLTWFFISNSTEIEKQYFLQSFKEANYGWIFIALFLAFLSHLSRAYRWKYLLEPLGYKPKLSLMYHSVMIGYVINLTIPRSGELARAGYFSKYQKASPDKIFGTIIVERVVDLLMFGLVILITFLFQVDQEQLSSFNTLKSQSLPSWVLPSILALFLVGLISIISVKKLRSKAVGFIKGIIEGCFTILKLKNKIAFILHTVFIWSAYVGMFWITALAVPEMDSISIKALFACFVAGAIAIGATPGGIGLYPIMVAAVLTNMYGYQGEVAKSFSMLMWSTQTIFIVFLGLLSLLLIKNKKEHLANSVDA